MESVFIDSMSKVMLVSIKSLMVSVVSDGKCKVIDCKYKVMMVSVKS